MPKKRVIHTGREICESQKELPGEGRDMSSFALFVMDYGWALLIIVVAILALWYFGVFRLVAGLNATNVTP